MPSYRLGGIKATYDQKADFVLDVLKAGAETETFLGYALNFLTWREVQEIGYLATQHLKRSDEAYDNRTETEQVNAR